MDSPRGRIYLMRAVTDGNSPLDDRTCAGTSTCASTAAPASRPARPACSTASSSSRSASTWRRRCRRPKPLELDRTLLAVPPDALSPGGCAGRWHRSASCSGPASTGSSKDSACCACCRARCGRCTTWCRVCKPHYGRCRRCLPAEGKRRARVALFLGCAGDAFLPQTNLATARVLQRNGCEVWIPRDAGLLRGAALPRRPGGAGPSNLPRPTARPSARPAGRRRDHRQRRRLRRHAQGLRPPAARHAAAAAGAAFAGKVRDVSEFLIALGLVKPEHPLPIRATYHDACHLCHAQQIRKQPRQLLEMIPGLELVPLAETEICCGAAGSYNITQPEMADRLGERKAKNILATGAQAVFTGNVGCLLQIGRHLRERTLRPVGGPPDRRPVGQLQRRNALTV